MPKKQLQPESFGMVVFAGEWPKHPELHPGKNHTFAAFVHEKPGGQIEQYVISWLPENGIINGLLQVGANFSLEDSLHWCFELGLAVYAWHAYEIRSELFDSALRRINALTSGDYRYYFFGTGPRNLNCTHALSGLDIIPPPDVPLAIYGVPASQACLKRMGRWSWPSSSPSEYEHALNLPSTIKWLKDGSPLSATRPIDPKQYYTALANDLPAGAAQTKGDRLG